MFTDEEVNPITSQMPRLRGQIWLTARQLNRGFSSWRDFEIIFSVDSNFGDYAEYYNTTIPSSIPKSANNQFYFAKDKRLLASSIGACCSEFWPLWTRLAFFSPPLPRQLVPRFRGQ